MLATAKHALHYNTRSRNIFPVSMEGCVLSLPLWQEDMQSSPFLSYDQYHHSCAVTGATWGTTGRTFDGTNQIIDLTDDATTASVLNFVASAFSIGMWFYLVGTAAANAALFWRGDLIVKGYGIQLREDGERVTFKTFQGGAEQATSSAVGSFPANTWHHLVVTRSGANALIYKNGVDATDTAGTHINPVTNELAARIGENNDAAYDYEGSIGDVWVYNRALSAAEILHIYNVTKWRYY